MSAEQIIAKLRAALADLADAERRFSSIRREGRIRRPDLLPAVADLRYRDTPQMRQAMEDWGTAHTRIQSYGAAATALLLDELLHRPGAEDSHDLHPAAPAVPYDGYAVGGRRPA